jgi:hypothetical protein
LADDADAGTAMKAIDLLGKYGGMSYTEAESRVEITPRAEVVRYLFPDNGRERSVSEITSPPSPPPRASRRSSRANSPNGGTPLRDGGPGFLWPDGTRRVIPPE